MSFIRSLAQKVGIDKAIAYSSGARVIQAVAGICLIFFVSTFLTGVEQGFYYTFGSILALQVFFELGLTGIMTQYVAHEVSCLHLSENQEYTGDERSKSRLASLVHFCVKWYSTIAVLVFIFLLIVGFIYFNKYGNSQEEIVAWRSPWVLICIATSFQLFISPLNSILSGLGFVKDTSKISFIQQLVVPICIFIGLASGLKLYVTGIGYLLNVAIWVSYTSKHKLLNVLRNLWFTDIRDSVAYMVEIFPYQWKIALSWVSGYFIYQLFNPVLFATEGAVVAGQMGMTLQALNAISAFSMSWMNTKIPLYSSLIAQKEYTQLDKIFNKTLKQLATVCLSLLLLFYLVVSVLRFTEFRLGDVLIADRFIEQSPLIIMLIPVFCNAFIVSWANYLRCHKKEPFLVNSIVMGIACCLSTVLGGYMFGLYGVVIGYSSLTLFIALPWSHRIYIYKRKEWHGQ